MGYFARSWHTESDSDAKTPDASDERGNDDVFGTREVDSIQTDPSE